MDVGEVKSLQCYKYVFRNSEAIMKSCETCSMNNISKIIFTGFKVKDSEIRLNSENLHP